MVGMSLADLKTTLVGYVTYWRERDAKAVAPNTTVDNRTYGTSSRTEWGNRRRA